MSKLSVVIPVYNESVTLRQILEKVIAVDIDKEIIIVDDGSSDFPVKALEGIYFSNLKLIHHSSNRGKGAAVLTGLANAAGEFVIIQDADLEYDPQDFLKLMRQMEEDNVDLVLGARFLQGYSGLAIPRFGNRLLTSLLNFLFAAKLNDCMTCYKLSRRDIFNALALRSSSFSIEIEIVAKALKKNLKIKEVPISYKPRDYSQGKKIKWLNGIEAVLNIIKYRFVD